jgi:hypothetical protein
MVVLEMRLGLKSIVENLRTTSGLSVHVPAWNLG